MGSGDHYFLLFSAAQRPASPSACREYSAHLRRPFPEKYCAFFGSPGISKCSAEMNSACAKVFACGENACTRLRRAPLARGRKGRIRFSAAQRPASPSVCRECSGHLRRPFPKKYCAFFGSPGISKCSAEMNSACAKVFACGENACTRLRRAPLARGRRGWIRFSAAQRPASPPACREYSAHLRRPLRRSGCGRRHGAPD